jgi:uncharacterized protein
MHQDSNAINWFEIPVSNFDKAKKFYESIFGFTMHVNEMAGFMMGFFPAYKGKVSGAIVSGNGYVPSKDGAKLYLNCNPDLSMVLDKVEAAGGKIVAPKTMIGPDLGYYAFILDSEGNTIGLHSQN